MINKSELKYIQSFAHKKHWAQESVFIVEGPKVVQEVLDSNWTIQKIYALPEWISAQKSMTCEVETIDAITLERISQLQNPNKVVALVQKRKDPPNIELDKGLTIILDGIQDPGNLGTILRTADWFGCKQVLVTEDTVSVYNPKVIQSTMGSFLRVHVSVVDVEAILNKYQLPVYGALLEGDALYQTKMGKEGCLIIGNESKGIRPGLQKYISKAVSIPRYGGAESLNAAVATGIILSHWKSHLTV